MTDLATYIRANAPLAPERAAILVAELGQQVARWHAEGRACGPLEPATRVEADHLVLDAGGSGRGHAADDVRDLGLILAGLLGVSLDRGRPDGVPPKLWSLIQSSVDVDPRARPTAVVLAAQLQEVARELLLGVRQWPAVQATPAYVPGPDGEPEEPDRPLRRPRRRFLILAAIAAAVVVAGSAGAFFILSGHQDEGVGPVRSGGQPGERPPASPTRACLGSDCIARVTFHPGGAHLVVCDAKADGLSAVAVYTRSDNPAEQTIWASKGNGTCTDQKLEVEQGTKIVFKACTGDNPKKQIIQCSDPVTVTV